MTNQKSPLLFSVGLSTVCAVSLLYADTAAPSAPVTVLGKIEAHEDISAVEKVGKFLAIAADEVSENGANLVQLLQTTAVNNQYKTYKNIELFPDKEMDIEGMAVDGGALYITASHALRRKKTKSNKSYANNRRRFQHNEIQHEKSRDWLYRVQLDANGEVLKKDKTSLRKLLDKDPVLKTFSSIPGKENGIDIEGLAAKDGWLYAGLRGPVFRANYAPVIKLKFNKPEKSYELLFVRMGGMGIRSICTVENGFFIIGGPVGDLQLDHQLYFWNGKDMIPGKQKQAAEKGFVKPLMSIPRYHGGNAEGMAVIGQTASHIELLIAYDGVENENKVFRRISVKTDKLIP